MSFSVKFERSASHDLIVAFDWYETKQAGLGEEFLRSVAVVEDLLTRDPMRFAIANEPYRSAKLQLQSEFHVDCGGGWQA